MKKFNKVKIIKSKNLETYVLKNNTQHEYIKIELLLSDIKGNTHRFNEIYINKKIVENFSGEIRDLKIINYEDKNYVVSYTKDTPSLLYEIECRDKILIDFKKNNMFKKITGIFNKDNLFQLEKKSNSDLFLSINMKKNKLTY